MSNIINIVSVHENEVKSSKVEASPYEFTMATRAKWEMVIADEDMTIGKGRFEKIKIKQIAILKDTLALPCAFNHHALASVIKIAGKGGCSAPVESNRFVDTAYILGIRSGEIIKGDLLGVFNIFPIMFTREATVPMTID
jgi:hypothetical protein